MFCMTMANILYFTKLLYTSSPVEKFSLSTFVNTVKYLVPMFRWIQPVV